jgi:hypothetical protein
VPQLSAPILDVGLLTVVGVSCEASVEPVHSQAMCLDYSQWPARTLSPVTQPITNYSWPDWLFGHKVIDNNNLWPSFLLIKLPWTHNSTYHPFALIAPLKKKIKKNHHQTTSWIKNIKTAFFKDENKIYLSYIHFKYFMNDKKAWQKSMK